MDIKKHKIGLIGALGNGESTSSGQIIRTNILYEQLSKHYGRDSIFIANSSILKNNPFKLIYSFIKTVFVCHDLVIILSINGMLKLWPIFSIMSKYCKKNIYNNVIGGNIVSHVENNPKLGKYMKSFKINWVQSVTMQKELKKFGIYNTAWLPNSKPIRILNESELLEDYSEPFSFCTFSRVSREKGVELAIETIKAINEDAGMVIATLDIYGKPDDSFADEFSLLIESVPDFIRYQGVVPFDESVKTLQKYFMLLFPTTFYGEGFPGTIIDAFASGTPVIASTWSCNTELISHSRTGLLYDYSRPKLLKDNILYAMAHKEEINGYRMECLKEARKYTPNLVYPIIFEEIER